jgi:hypothetical protein
MRRTNERRALGRGSWVAVWSMVLLGGVACAHRQKVMTERRPDGIVHLTCKMSLADCLYEVENACDHRRYVVLRAFDGRDLKGLVPAQTLVLESEAYVRCGEMTAFGPENKALLATPVCTPPAVPAVPPRVCAPGATQACVGPAGCSGGQACVADGSRFGTCDCGAPAAVPAPATPATP